jgi:hypothetical protein
MNAKMQGPCTRLSVQGLQLASVEQTLAEQLWCCAYQQTQLMFRLKAAAEQERRGAVQIY